MPESCLVNLRSPATCVVYSTKTSAQVADQNVRDHAFFFLLARIVVECPAASEVESAAEIETRLLKGFRKNCCC